MTFAEPGTASLYRRSIAWLVDFCLISSLAAAVVIIIHPEGATAIAAPDGGTAYELDPDGWFAVVGLVVAALYCIPLWASVAATPGQLVMGMRIHGLGTQRRLSVPAAAIRWAVLWGVFGLIGAAELLLPGKGGWLLALQGLWLAFLLASVFNNRARQALHDRLAGSVVVKSWLAGALDSMADLLGKQVSSIGQRGAFVPEAWRKTPDDEAGASQAPAPQAPAAVSAPPLVLAGLGRRVGAFAIDSLALVMLATVAGAMANVPGMAETTNAGSATVTGATFTTIGPSMVVLAIVSAVYCVPTWAAMGGTPGQWLLGLHVYRADSPRPLALPAAIVRWAALWGVFCGIGALTLVSSYVSWISFFCQLAWAVFLVYTAGLSARKQGFHDRLAGSLVVR